MLKLINCVNCGASMDTSSKFCTKCGTQIVYVNENTCINRNCIKHTNGYIFNKDDMYCNECGKPTDYGNKVLKQI